MKRTNNLARLLKMLIEELRTSESLWEKDLR
jgi:hypothetical protein